MRKNEFFYEQRFNDVYTNRINPKDVFWEEFDKYKREINSKQISIIHYYGVGGIGKTGLLDWISTELKNYNPKTKVIKHTLGINGDPYQIINKLRNLLLSKYSEFEFTLFDYAYFVYLGKLGENSSKNTINNFIAQSEPLKNFISKIENIEHISEYIKPISTHFYSAEGLANIIDIPVIETAKKVAEYMVKYRKVKKLKQIPELTKLIEMEEDEICKKMPYYFSLDMEENMKDEESQLIIFLDEYEKIQFEEYHKVGKVSTESLLCGENGLINLTPKVQWIIFGRDEIDWTKHRTVKNVLKSHLVDNLSVEDTNRFLTRAGVEESDLYRQIYRLTNGIPLFLQSFLEYYKEEKKNKSKIVDINIECLNMEMLLDRYLEIIADDGTREMIYVLSCLPFWDDNKISSFFSMIQISFNTVTYNRVKKMSFIREATGVGESERRYLCINPVIRKVLYYGCNEQIKNKISKYLDVFVQENLKSQEKYHYWEDEDGNNQIEHSIPIYSINLLDFEWYVKSRLLSFKNNNSDIFYEKYFQEIRQVMTDLFIYNGLEKEIDNLIMNIIFTFIRDIDNTIEVPKIMLELALTYDYLDFTLGRDSKKSKVLTSRKITLAKKAIDIIEKIKNISDRDRVNLNSEAANYLSIEHNELKLKIRIEAYEFEKKHYRYKFNFVEATKNLIYILNDLSNLEKVEEYMIELLNMVLNYNIKDNYDPVPKAEREKTPSYMSNPVVGVYMLKAMVPYEVLIDIYCEVISAGFSVRVEETLGALETQLKEFLAAPTIKDDCRKVVIRKAENELSAGIKQIQSLIRQKRVY